jgi:hypothetical protein
VLIVLISIGITWLWKPVLLAAVWSSMTSAIGVFFISFTQSHPHFSRILHVFLDIVPDLEAAALALAGLVYLIPNMVKRVEESKVVRGIVLSSFLGLAVLTVMVNAINREQENHSKEEQENKIDSVAASNAQILNTLVGKKDLTEADRRTNIEKALRSEYITTHDRIDPEVLAGNRMPPEGWMNQRLHELGERWTLAPPPPVTSTAPHGSEPSISIATTSLAGDIETGKDFTLQIALAPLKRQKPLEVRETTLSGEYNFSEDPLVQSANEEYVWNQLLHGPPTTPLEIPVNNSGISFTVIAKALPPDSYTGIVAGTLHFYFLVRVTDLRGKPLFNFCAHVDKNRLLTYCRHHNSPA